jgi:hypothetical protein
VVTVSVDGVPGFTDGGLRPHVGGLAVVGETAHVSDTELLNPFSAPTEIVEVAEVPGFTKPGTRADAVIVKLACAYFATKTSAKPGPALLA